MAFRLETERLWIREWNDADREPFRRIATDPAVMRFINAGVPWSDQQIDAFLARQRDQAARLGFCLAALELRESGELAGQAGIQPLGSTGQVEVGWWLRPDCWRRGLATEAARALVRFAFEEAGLRRLVAIAHPDNRRSHAVMERLGMTRRSRHRGRDLGLRDPDAEVVLYALERAAVSGGRAARKRDR